MSLQTDAGDNSVTQFAVLGLWVARKHQVPVDRSLLMAEAHARATQKDEGGWAYSPGRLDSDRRHDLRRPDGARRRPRRQ